MTLDRSGASNLLPNRNLNDLAHRLSNLLFLFGGCVTSPIEDAVGRPDSGKDRGQQRARLGYDAILEL
jgi:hypothetical protein